MSGPEAVVPFAPRVQQAVLDELRRRLLATEWTDAPVGLGWSAGIDVAELRDLVAHWADGFDWRAAEERLNRLPRFRTAFDGLGIHFVHARASAGSRPAMPLLLAHGWPDSFWRYSEVVPLLVDPGAHGGDPADAFDVVVPDMPGFGYSNRPPQTLDLIAVAHLWARLMERLGYPRFAASGGDIGSSVVSSLALDYPERVAAVHLTDAVFMSGVDRETVTAQERDWLGRLDRWEREEGGYEAMQATKPQTAAVGLTDSPAGLAAWIFEKLRAWSDRRPDGASLIDRDAMLTDVTIYWLTGTIGSSMRMYQANSAIAKTKLSRTLEVPTGYTLYPADIEPPAPDAWLARTTTDLAYVSRPERGGHFAPIEDPESYAKEIRQFFRPYRRA